MATHFTILAWRIPLGPRLLPVSRILRNPPWKLHVSSSAAQREGLVVPRHTDLILMSILQGLRRPGRRFIYCRNSRMHTLK